MPLRRLSSRLALGDLREGVALASRSIASGAALAALETSAARDRGALKDPMPDTGEHRSL